MSTVGTALLASVIAGGFTGVGALPAVFTSYVSRRLQNMPEGLVVALALVSEHYSRPRAIGIALLTGLTQPLGALVGSAAISFSQALLPWGWRLPPGPCSM